MFQIGQLLQRLFFFSFRQVIVVVVLSVRANLIVVVSKHIPDPLVLPRRTILVIQARAAIVNHQDALLVLNHVVVVVGAVAVQQQERDFLALLVDWLHGQIEIATAVDEDDTSQAVCVVRIVLVGQPPQLRGQVCH